MENKLLFFFHNFLHTNNFIVLDLSFILNVLASYLKSNEYMNADVTPDPNKKTIL